MEDGVDAWGLALRRDQRPALRCLQVAGRFTYGINPDGAASDGRLEIVERHAVLADF